MTERDLYEYLRYKKEIKRLRAKYHECELYMNSPKYPNLASVPGGGDGEEKLMKLMDERREIERKIEELVSLRNVAEKRLDRVSEILVNPLEVDVLNLLYREGRTVVQIAVDLSYTKMHIYRQRKSILATISALQ